MWVWGRKCGKVSSKKRGEEEESTLEKQQNRPKIMNLVG